VAELASVCRKEFNTERTENAESPEKKKQVRLKPDPTQTTASRRCRLSPDREAR
jgi:hypothetical protein